MYTWRSSERPDCSCITWKSFYQSIFSRRRTIRRPATPTIESRLTHILYTKISLSFLLHSQSSYLVKLLSIYSSFLSNQPTKPIHPLSTDNHVSKMSSSSPVCVANTHLLIHVSRSAIITVWILTALLQVPCFISILVLLNAPDFFSFCSGQRDDPFATPHLSGSGCDRKIIPAPKIDGRLRMMRSKSLQRFGIGLGLWILAATCFVFEGLAIGEAQFCSGDSGRANLIWAFPWAMYGIVQGLMMTVAGLSVRGLWLERHRLESRVQKGKTRAESIDSVEKGKVTPNSEEDEGMWEMHELDPQESTRNTERVAARGTRRAMRGIAGEGSSKMGESRHQHLSRCLSIVSSTAESMTAP